MPPPILDRLCATPSCEHIGSHLLAPPHMTLWGYHTGYWPTNYGCHCMTRALNVKHRAAGMQIVVKVWIPSTGRMLYYVLSDWIRSRAPIFTRCHVHSWQANWPTGMVLSSTNALWNKQFSVLEQYDCRNYHCLSIEENRTQSLHNEVNRPGVIRLIFYCLVSCRCRGHNVHP